MILDIAIDDTGCDNLEIDESIVEKIINNRLMKNIGVK